MKLLFLAALLSAAVANAAINDPCSVGSIPGICITTSSCTNAGGTYASGYCPNDPSNVRCCHKTCGGGGRCRFTSTCPTGKIQRGLCPGPSTFTCCLPILPGDPV